MRILSPITAEVSWPRRNFSSDLMADLFADFDQIADTLRTTHGGTTSFQPSCDIKEAKDHYLVSVDMPGVKKEDIKMEVKGTQLVVSGERHYEVGEETGESTLRHERFHGKFERTFGLPATINTDKIEAQYENGVLSIALPKSDAAKGRTIQIQSGQGGFLNKLWNSKKDTSAKELKDVKLS